MELQECAERGLRAVGKAARQHIESCDICREKISEYRLLLNSLEQEPESILSGNFASKVVNRLNLQPKESFIERYIAELAGAFGLLAAIVAIAFIFDPIQIAVAIMQASSSIQTTLYQKIETISQTIIQHRSSTLMIFGLSTIFAIWIIDRLFRRGRLPHSIFIS